jgi:hypothetical protein
MAVKGKKKRAVTSKPKKGVSGKKLLKSTPA